MGMHDAMDDAKFEDGTPWADELGQATDDEPFDGAICEETDQVYADGTPKTAEEAARQIQVAQDWLREMREAREREQGPFDASFDRQYELARQIGDRRFGSACEHARTDGHRCVDCGRLVI